MTSRRIERRGNRKPSIKSPEEFLKREPYKTIIPVFVKLKNTPLKTGELRYLLLKKHKLEYHEKIGLRVIKGKTLKDYRREFAKFDFKPQNLSNHLSLLISEPWKLLMKDNNGYRLSKKGFSLAENYKKETIFNCFKELLDEHSFKTARETLGNTSFLVLGLNEEKLEPKYYDEIKKHIQDIDNSTLKIENILTKSKYEDFISIVAHIYPEKGYERGKKNFIKKLRSGKYLWFSLLKKQP